MGKKIIFHLNVLPSTPRLACSSYELMRMDNDCNFLIGAKVGAMYMKKGRDTSSGWMDGWMNGRTTIWTGIIGLIEHHQPVMMEALDCC